MKKIPLICAAVLLCLGIALGGMHFFGRVSVTAQRKIYPLGTEEIICTWRNGTLKTVSFGAFFRLEIWDGSEWADVEPLNEIMFKMIGYGLKPGLWYKITYNTRYPYGPLQAGQYRITAAYSVQEGESYSDDYPVYAAFEIK